MRKVLTLLAWWVLTTFAHKAHTEDSQLAGKAETLNATIVVSDTPDNAKNWLSTPKGQPVRIKRVKKLAPNQTGFINFLISGMISDKDGQFEVDVSFFIIDPNNEILTANRNYTTLTGALPVNPMFIMADPTVEIIFEESDLRGSYQVYVEGIDKISGEKATSRYIFELSHDD